MEFPCRCLVETDPVFRFRISARADAARALTLFLSGVGSVDGVIGVVNGEDLLSLQPHRGNRLISLRKPEWADFLVTPYKINSLNPKRKFSRGVAGYLDDSEVLLTDPNSAFEEVFVFTLGMGLDHVTRVGSDLILSEQLEGVVSRINGTVAMISSCCRLFLALNEAIQDQAPNYPGALFGFLGERLLVRCAVVDINNLLRIDLLKKPPRSYPLSGDIRRHGATFPIQPSPL